MCSQITGKIANWHTFLITITQHKGFSFRRNCLWLDLIWWNDWGYKRILRNRWKRKEFNFSCESCRKYVSKHFSRHSIWSWAIGTRERFYQPIHGIYNRRTIWPSVVKFRIKHQLGPWYTKQLYGISFIDTILQCKFY